MFYISMDKGWMYIGMVGFIGLYFYVCDVWC